MKKTKIIILAHMITTVPAYDLRQYFLEEKKVDELLFIGLPLFYKEGRPGRYYEYYKDGKLVEEVKKRNKKEFLLRQYFLDFIITIFWILKFRRKWDIAISLDNLNTTSALVLKALGLIDAVIYYTIDFTPVRFTNKLLNSFYHFLDKLCVKYSTITWNLTTEFAKGREKYNNMPLSKYHKQIIVPIGIWFNRLKRLPFENINKTTVIYAGGLVKHQGIQIVLQSIPKILQEIPSFKFKIIGLGDYDADLKNIVKELAIEEHVEFLGYFENHADVESELAKYAIGMAMYSPNDATWSYFADPSKIKSYLSAGLVVLTTNVTYMGKELEKYNCGKIIEYTPESIAKNIIHLLKDDGSLKEMREKSVEFIKMYNWISIYDNAFKESNIKI